MNNLDFTDEYFLFWRTKPTLMIGRFQNTIQEINKNFVENNNIDVVRRNSGGGAIYTDEDCWQFSFITWKEKGKIKDFKSFTKPVIDALAKLGIAAEFSGRNDLMLNGKKFSGNAQFGIKDRFLHHGTILFNTNLDNLIKSLNVGDDKVVSKGIKSVRERVTNIKPFLKNPNISSLEFKNTMIALLKSDIKQITISNEEIKEIEKIEKGKFLAWDWNYGISPEFNITKSKKFDGGKVEIMLDVKDGIIQSCKISGDFFLNGNIKELEKSVIDCRYEKSDILNVLNSIYKSNYIYNISLDDLLSCFI
jgi:lipoate-protein ligase A